MVGGWLGNLLLGTSAGATAGALSIPSIIFAIIGALVLLFLWGMFTRRTV